MILVRVPCSSLVCLGTRKLSAPVQKQIRGVNGYHSMSGKQKIFSWNRFILFQTEFCSLRVHLLRARSATSTVITSSLFILSLESVIRENKESRLTFKAYLTLSTRVRHCLRFFPAICPLFLLSILLNIQLKSQNI